ncbi:MAG: hypothetical protein E6H01_00860 [Bacillati bacterium ANGP1]|uniref:Uncharacterized protein n=1 Tax=Candidatus Segetimicrobium genomatis TaxID=2569760 RepID=A0A537LFG1_9BACT|nr:MAG: hypothetical protein E6H01_00860 [Terrabacteria group bacterium ANGP1]
MRGLPRGLVVVLVLLSASAGWQLFAVHSLLGARDAQLAAFGEQAYRQARQVAQLQEYLRARDRKVITLLEMVSQQDQELVELRTQVDRSRVRDRIELSRSNLSLLASALEHFFKDNGQYPARLAELVPKYLGAIPLEPCTNASYVYRPVSRPRLDYGLSTGGYPASSECSRVAAGLSFAPALGLVNQP